MDVKNTFNIILLSLSLTTLLITIISYIVFRLRYSIQKKNDQELHKLEGSFFRRFSPHLKKINDEYKEKIKTKVNKREFWRNRPVYLFLLIGIAIAIIFSTEGYFIFNKELKKRQDISTNYRELLSKGLLKVQHFDPENQISDSEFLSSSFKERQQILFGLVRKLQVTVFSPASVQNDTKHIVGRQSWLNWLTKHQIQNRIDSECDSLLNADLVILPNVGGENDVDQCIKKIIEVKGGAIFSGPSTSQILLKDLKIEIKHEADVKTTGTALFRSSLMLGETPAGLLLDWQPVDRSYHFQAPFQDTLAFYYKGDSFALGLELEPLIVATKRSVWMAMEPTEGIDNIVYMDHILATLMANVAKLPLTRVAPWPMAQDFVTAIAVDSEDKLENLPKVVKLIKEHGHPVTAFVVSDLIVNQTKILESFDEADEIASHTDDHQPVGERTMDYDFERLQNSRVDLEEIHKKEVIGFRPPEEFYDLNSLNAIIQSGFSYMFADQKNFRLTPYLINNGDFIMIPRILEDDYLMKRNKLLDTPEGFKKNLQTQFQFVRSVGGAHLLSVHTNFLGEDPLMLEGFKLFLEGISSESSGAKLTFNHLAQWWRNKDKIISWIEIDPQNKQILNVQNQGKNSLESVVIETYVHGKEESLELKKIELPKLTPNQHYTLELN